MMQEIKSYVKRNHALNFEVGQLHDNVRDLRSQLRMATLHSKHKPVSMAVAFRTNMIGDRLWRDIKQVRFWLLSIGCSPGGGNTTLSPAHHAGRCDRASERI